MPSGTSCSTIILEYFTKAPVLSQDASDEPATTSQDTYMLTPIATGYHSNGAVANDMLNIFFGSLSQGSPKKVPAATSTPDASQDKRNYSTAAVGFEAPTPFSVPEGVSVTVPAARTDLAAFGGELQPKKKSSLKDRVKMLLS